MIPDELAAKIVSEITGTAVSVEDIIDVYNLDINKNDREQLRFQLESFGIEQCDLCGTWVDKEKLEDTLMGKYCEDCQSAPEEDYEPTSDAV